jgi:hypothetical protein
MRLGEWKLAIVTEDIELDDHEELDEAPVRVRTNPNKPANRTAPRVQRQRYLDKVKENTSPEAVFDEVMRQLVTIKLQDLLACSPTF